MHRRQVYAAASGSGQSGKGVQAAQEDHGRSACADLRKAQKEEGSMNRSVKNFFPPLHTLKECFGCGEPTMERYRDLPMCADCIHERGRLEEIYVLPSSEEKAKQAPAVRCFAQRMQLRRWLDVLMILVALGCWSYLAHAVYVAIAEWIYVAIAEWIRAGGLQ
jgi:hypothetical protein